MINICELNLLKEKYNMLELMICQSTFQQMNQEMNDKIAYFVNHAEEIKNIQFGIWVCSFLCNIYRDLKFLNKTHEVFDYNVDFSLNNKMKDNEYKIYLVGIKLLNNYTIEVQEQNET